MKKLLGFIGQHKTIAVGCLCGLLCALCIFLYTSGVQKKADQAQSDALAQYGGSQIEVCVARNDIAAGSVILDSDIELRTWIATMLPENAVTNKADAVGKVAGSTILSGEVVSSSRFGLDVSVVDVPDDLVAVSLPVREVQAVGGSLSPGMVVDIYSVSSSSATLIDSAVSVLEVSAFSQSSSSSNSWVTVAVEPESVEELVGAAENFELYFALPSEKVIEARLSAASKDTDSEDSDTAFTGVSAADFEGSSSVSDDSKSGLDSSSEKISVAGNSGKENAAGDENE